jgi:hypothetical protein
MIYPFPIGSPTHSRFACWYDEGGERLEALIVTPRPLSMPRCLELGWILYNTLRDRGELPEAAHTYAWEFPHRLEERRCVGGGSSYRITVRRLTRGAA